MKRIVVGVPFLVTVIVTFFAAAHAYAFSASGCEGDCKKCHSLNREDVGGILKKLNIPNAKILNIELSPVKSLWEISIENQGQRGLFYVDYSKKYVVTGQIIDVASGSNKTQERFEKLQQTRKVDVAKIPLANALVMGNPKAAKRVVLFTDPDCPYCGKLHKEMEKVVKERKDIVFYIKLFPLKMHKDAYWKSKSIVCNKSLKMLEDNFEQKPIPKTECDTREVDETIKLAESLGITGTPTMVLPNGRVHSGFLAADKLIELITGRR